MATVGHIVRPHGNRGQVVVAPLTDFAADRFGPGAEVHTQRDGRTETLTVTAGREHAGRWIVGLAGVESIDDAERLRGCDLRIPAEALRPLADGAYYLHDLAGCEVVTGDGLTVGRVHRVDITAGRPMLVVGPVDTGVEGADVDEVLVPFIDGICRHVDVEAKRIEIVPPEGLIDLNRRK